MKSIRKTTAEIGVEYETFKNWLKAGKVEEPEITVPSGRRYYTEKQIAKLKEQFAYMKK